MKVLLQRGATQARRQAILVATMTKAGVVRPYHPAKLALVGKALTEWGLGFAGGVTAMTHLRRDRTAIIDEIGELTWGEVDDRSTRLANALREQGVREGDGVAVLCRNHRYFLDVSTALAKLGADILYLNTAFAAPQLKEVFEREKPTVVVYDEEFGGLMDKAELDTTRVIAWADSDPEGLGATTVDQLIERGSTKTLRKPSRTARPIILTSGTTGTPKGAPRSEAPLDGAVALLAKMPLRHGGTTHIAAPLFHTWGWAHLNLALLLGSTVVLRRKFDPKTCLETVRSHRCDALVVIPVMLQRILALPEEERGGDWSFLHVTAASGSALPGDLGIEWMDAFGDNLYNTYGSTEVAWATIAQPRDLREAPGTAGRTPPNTVVRIYGEDDQELPAGQDGRIFVGNSMLFGGYTGGEESKAVIDGLMSSGDVGHLDEKGRLFIEGRDDEMIVSGGENVFPQEVEDCLARHDQVEEAAAIGVDDEDYGKRLRAFVVTRGEVDEDTLKGWVKDNLARYKVPREVVFLDELPRNATGKVLKRELAEYDGDGKRQDAEESAEESAEDDAEEGAGEGAGQGGDGESTDQGGDSR